MKTAYHILKIVLCLLSSYLLLFYVTGDLISYFFQCSFRFEQILYIIAFVVQAVMIHCVISHPHLSDIPSWQVKLIWFTYACVLLILLFGRSYTEYCVNLNILEMFNSSSFFQSLFNFVFFIPLGFLFKDRSRISIVICKAVLFSAGIECLQLITHRGIFDINDIILNTCGMAVGYYLSSHIPSHLKRPL